MGDLNIGGVNSTVGGTAVGRGATVYNAASHGPVQSAEEFAKWLDGLRAALQTQAAKSEANLDLADGAAAVAWLRQHYADAEPPPEAKQRLGALRRLSTTWPQLLEMAKQLPAGILAGWIVEIMK
jgi:hypothetical protein